MDQPRWLELAWADLGIAEAPGDADNPLVVRYYADAGHPEVRSDDVAWCAAFVGACLERAGIAGTRSLMARSYLAWGEAAPEPRVGALAVLSRGPDTDIGHVGFLVGLTEANVVLLGGNQADTVSVQSFARSRLLGLRWPATSAASQPAVIQAGAPAPRRNPAADSIFERALAHVLEMEGGYDEDPYDPGGPTNLGITLCRVRARQGHRAHLRQLRGAQGRAEGHPVRHRAPHLPRRTTGRPLAVPSCRRRSALFHFDAAVNQGVVGAARMLQQAVGAEVDGEIGPLTLAAVAGGPSRKRSPPMPRFAASATASLPTFWRFGRGWLARVDATLALASRSPPMPPLVPAPSKQRKADAHVHRSRTHRPGHPRCQVVGSFHDHLGRRSSPRSRPCSRRWALFSASTSRPSSSASSATMSSSSARRPAA